MSAINFPFAASATRRAPTSDELADGYGCGDADLQLFDFMAWWTTGQIDEVIVGAGLTTDDADLTQLREAVRALARTQTSTLLQQFVIIQDQKANGVNGGDFLAGAWRTRDLNTVVADPGGLIGAGVSLAANQITLGVGTWVIEAAAPACAVNSHKTRFQNITDGTTAIWGTTEQTSQNTTTDAVTTRSLLVGTVVIASGTKTFELQHRGEQNSTTFGLPIGFGFGAGYIGGSVPEIYSTVEIRKVA